MDSSSPSLFHVTHAKGGSTWITRILRTTFGNENLFPRFGSDYNKYAWSPATVYPALFVSRNRFLELPKDGPWRAFYVIRDPRDALVSLYFSVRYSHSTQRRPNILEFRNRVAEMSDVTAMELVFQKTAAKFAERMLGWLESDEIVVRYEDLLESKGEGLAAVFDRLEISFPRERFERALEAHWFESVYGRKLGEVDRDSHGRQGLPGDWQNYRTPALDAIVDEHFATVLGLAGYE